MLNELRKKDFPETMLKLMIVLALFFPAFTSKYESAYAPDLIATTACAFFFLVGVVLSKRRCLREKNYFGWSLLLLLVFYNVVALYVNATQLYWYVSQLNISIPVLMFLALVFLEKDELGKNEGLIRFFLEAIVVSNIIGLIIYALGNDGVWMMNGDIGLLPLGTAAKDERRYNWLYNHKSQYAFTLVLFLSLIVTYRRLFQKKWMYYGSIAVMIAGLLASNTMATMFATLFIFIGMATDNLLKRVGKLKAKHALYVIPVLCILALGVYLISRNRNIMTLGSRLYIWQGSIEAIRENPYGLGALCGIKNYTSTIPGYGKYTFANCHNVFLNFLYQLSIPAGLCVVAMLGWIVLGAWNKNRSFTTLGILAALWIPMMMDWCLLITELPIFLLTIYYIFFSPCRKTGEV